MRVFKPVRIARCHVLYDARYNRNRIAVFWDNGKFTECLISSDLRVKVHESDFIGKTRWEALKFYLVTMYNQIDRIFCKEQYDA